MTNNINNILSPLAILSLPSYIVYCLVNEQDRNFIVMGSESFLWHYSIFLKSLKKEDQILKDIFNNKIEMRILETLNSEIGFYKINRKLLVTKYYDQFIEQGYKPYRKHKLLRIKLIQKVQIDGKCNLYAKTTRGNLIFISQFNNIDDCTAYTKKKYNTERIYKLYKIYE